MAKKQVATLVRHMSQEMLHTCCSSSALYKTSIIIDTHEMTAIVLMIIQLHPLPSKLSLSGAVKILLHGERSAIRMLYAATVMPAVMPACLMSATPLCILRIRALTQQRGHCQPGNGQSLQVCQSSPCPCHA